MKTQPTKRSRGIKDTWQTGEKGDSQKGTAASGGREAGDETDWERWGSRQEKKAVVVVRGDSGRNRGSSYDSTDSCNYYSSSSSLRLYSSGSSSSRSSSMSSSTPPVAFTRVPLAVETLGLRTPTMRHGGEREITAIGGVVSRRGRAVTIYLFLFYYVQNDY